MRFKGTFRLMQQPRLYGVTRDSNYETFYEPSCHEFCVSDVHVDYSRVKYYSVEAAEVTLIAGEYAKGSLHGPASQIKDRTILYPCDVTSSAAG